MLNKEVFQILCKENEPDINLFCMTTSCSTVHIHVCYLEACNPEVEAVDALMSHCREEAGFMLSPFLHVRPIARFKKVFDDDSAELKGR